MRAATVLSLRPGRLEDDVEELTYIWRDAVEATHHFLSVEAIEQLETLVREEHLPRLELHVAETGESILGFIGMDKDHVAMLYVADEMRSQGVGSKLLGWAKERSPRLTLDVNEQNPRAVVFYIRRGFILAGRSADDAQGQPHPLLHMVWNAAPTPRV